MTDIKEFKENPSQYARLAYRTLDTELKGARHKAFKQNYEVAVEQDLVPSVEDLFDQPFISLRHWIGILDLAIRQEHLGAGFALINAKNHHIESLGALAAVIMTSKNLRQYLTLFETHAAALEPNSGMQVGRVKGGMTLTVSYPEVPPKFATCWCFAGFNMMEDGIRRTTLWRGDDEGETSVTFHFDVPHNAAEVDDSFYSEISYDPKASVGGFGWSMFISDRLLDIPNFMYDEKVNLAAVAACDARLQAMAKRKAKAISVGECTARVTQLMVMAVSIPSQDKVAEILKITPRALQKRLAAEDTSYQSIKDTVMLKKVESLIAGGSSTERVAEVLKVSKEAMYRKVKKMTGMTIGEHMKTFSER